MMETMRTFLVVVDCLLKTSYTVSNGKIFTPALIAEHIY